ncbi:MAG: hypothetical protein EKK48_12150 [Candidatus Melainabacteria bacterium]|nr:MAG: hypothetical protein EKK48_12150 [Candidatus Melainabacteria bacterium]
MTEETQDIEYEEEDAQAEVSVVETSGGAASNMGQLAQISQNAMTGNVAVAAQRAAVEVLTQVYAAQNKPRNLAVFRKRALELASQERFAETAIYCLPLGDSFKEGPSTAMMDSLIDEYQNVQVETIEHGYSDQLQQSSGEIILWNYESNVRKVAKINIQHTSQKKQLIGWQTKAALSKERRNLIKRTLPADVVAEVYDKCIQTVDMSIGKNKAAIPSMLSAFRDIGIEEGRLRAFLGIHPSEKRALGDYKPAEVRRLRSVYAAINSGEAKPSDFFKGASNTAAAAKQAERKAKQEETKSEDTNTKGKNTAVSTAAPTKEAAPTAEASGPLPTTEPESSSKAAAASADPLAPSSADPSPSSAPGSETEAPPPIPESTKRTRRF